MTDTRRKDMARAIDPGAFADWSGAHDPRAAGEQANRQADAYEAADRVLAVLPAPPVVDEADIEAAAITEARVRFRRQRMNVGTPQDREEQAFREGAAFAARLRGATR
jgi:hypothetical protein